MQKIPFSKMHGLGNDFIIIEKKLLPDNIDYHKLATKLCDRHFSIGADGLIIVNPYKSPDADTSWRIFNSDGSEPEMCGNGIRCFAKYVFDKKIVDKTSFNVATLAGIITPEIESNGLITVDMGKPTLSADKIPVNLPLEKIIDYTIKVNDRSFNINCVNMGNPHCVIFIEEDIDVAKYGPIIEKNQLFPEKTNVEFVKVITKSHLKVDVWERGCGITLACGTGACACVVAAYYNNLTNSKVKVSLPGGDLTINFEQSSGHIFMTGLAEYAFEGEFYL